MLSLRASITGIQDEQTQHSGQLAAVQSQLDAAHSATEMKLDLLSNAVNSILRRLETLNMDTAQVTGGSGETQERTRRYLTANPESSGQEREEADATVPALTSSFNTTYTVSEKLKIWKRTMSLNVVRTKGDPKFSAARHEFIRMHGKFPLSDDVERELLMLAFQGAALKIASTVNRENPAISAVELWDKLALRLYNDSQRKARNSSFSQMTWNEKKQSVEQFPERLHLLGSSLEVSSDMIEATFIRGLPARLQPFAHSIKGSFDDIVSAVSNVSTSLALGVARRSEQVRELIEGEKNQTGEASEMERRDSTVKRTKLCYRCGQPGYFAVDWRCPMHPSKRAQSGKEISTKEKEMKEGNSKGGATFQN